MYQYPPWLLAPDFSHRESQAITAGPVIQLVPADMSRILIVVSQGAGSFSIGLSQNITQSPPIVVQLGATPYHIDFSTFGPIVGQQWWLLTPATVNVMEVFWRPTNRKGKR